MKVILINEQATQFVLSYAYTALGGDKSSLQCGAYIIRLSLKLLTSKSLASHRRIMTPLKDEKRQYQRWMDADDGGDGDGAFWKSLSRLSNSN